jgi:hypothetical protein
MNESRTAQIFSAAAKVGLHKFKANAKALYGESEIDAFGNLLRRQTRDAFDAVASTQHLNQLQDLELITLYLAFDSSVSDVAHYRPILQDLLKRFQREVLPIGDSSFESEYGQGERQYTDVYWINDAAGKRRLALVHTVETYGLMTSTRRYFGRWISDDLQEMAIKRSGGSPSTLKRKDVQGL